MRYDRDIIERVRQALRDAPAREPKPSLAGAIRGLAPDLLKARSEKNLSWDEVLALVENAGVKISTETLKRYLRDARRAGAPSTARAAKSKAPPNPKAKPSSSSKPPSPGGPAEIGQGQAKPTPPMPKPPPPARAAEGSQGQARPIPPMPKPPPPGRSPDAAQGGRKPIPPMPKPPPPGTASVEKSETEDEEVVPAWSFPLRRDRDRI